MRTRAPHVTASAEPAARVVLPAPALPPVVVDMLLDGVVICDADGNVVQANQAVSRLLGLTSDQITGAQPLDPGWEATLRDGSPYTAADAPALRAVTTGLPQHELLHVRRPDGTQSWLSVRAMPLPRSLTDTPAIRRLVAVGGREARPGAAVASIVDVSDQMVQQRLLSESEQRFRLTLANAPIGIALVATNGYFLEVNAELERLLGRTGEELAGLRFHDVTHPDDLATDVALVEALLRDEIPKYQLEKRYLHSDGSLVWGRLTVTLIRAADGTPRYFVSQIEDISEVRTAQAQLERRALYDPLTGLANRTLLLDRLNQAVRQHQDDQEMVAVAYCDLDHFTRVNDSLGHAAGDELLRVVASRMTDALRPGDTLARLGGDEFVVVLDSVRSLEEATALLTVVKGSVEWPTEIDGHEVTPSFSAGLAISDGVARSAEVLLRDADTALYSAKQRGRSHWEVFTSAMRARALAELSVENALRRALDDEAFELHYQPVVDLESRAVIAFEALVRWQHPDRGLLLPGEFLDVAEDAHLMVPLGRLVIRQACAFLARHPDAPWRVFVNVSPQQIGAADLAGVLATELEAAGVPAWRLAVEITENGVLDAFGVSLRDMQRIAESGVDLVMDDFGTGYSALSSLLAAPIAGVKLDRSFTARLGDGAGGDRITATVGNLVTSLGAYGVVEGVETEDQRQRAFDHGWRLGQGYLFGRPLPERRLGGVLRRLRA